MANEFFTEEQRFRQNAFWLPYVVVGAAVVGYFVYHIAMKAGGAPLHWLGMFLSLWLFCAAGLFVWLSKLQVAVDAGGLHIRFYPLERTIHHWKWDDIADWRVDTVRPLRDYGGWGVRRGRDGKAYLVNGNRCVMLNFKNGRTLCIGSNKPEELAAALERGKNGKT